MICFTIDIPLSMAISTCHLIYTSTKQVLPRGKVLKQKNHTCQSPTYHVVNILLSRGNHAERTRTCRTDREAFVCTLGMREMHLGDA